MKNIKLLLAALLLGLGTLTMLGASVESNLWELGSSNDWLSVGPVYHTGPFFYPNSDLDLGTQRFLNTYPSYIPASYSNKPVALGNYTSAINYRQGYNYPYYANDPQAALDYAVANHQYQKYLNNYYNRYYWNYGT
jgi:hypothetical protein